MLVEQNSKCKEDVLSSSSLCVLPLKNTMVKSFYNVVYEEWNVSWVDSLVQNTRDILQVVAAWKVALQREETHASDAKAVKTSRKPR